MEKHTYADALRRGEETASQDLSEGIERSFTSVPGDQCPNPNTPHASIRSQAADNDEPSVTIEENLAGEAIEAATEDPTTSALPGKCAPSPEELYYRHQIFVLYRRSIKTIHAWLAWEGYGSPGNTAQPTPRLVELAERARWRNAMPSATELWALEVAIDCAQIVRRIEEEGESMNGQHTSKTSAVDV
ncbi:MAG: hypothetical protein Q9195_005312 [Heterodermia aff. obscurata]